MKLGGDVHYEKSCPQQLDCPIIRAPKQLIYNNVTNLPWKYMDLVNKLSHWKIKELYCSCKLVARWTFM
jgi:hypothetical protein